MPLGVRCVVLEPAAHPPAAAAAEVLTRPYDDGTALAELARRCDVVTIEVEHVPVESLAWLAERLPVHPSTRGGGGRAGPLGREAAVRPPRHPHRAVRAGRSWMAGAFAAGTIVKRRTGGFDGRGQVRLGPSASRRRAGSLPRRRSPAPAWPRVVVRFDRELSVVAARSCDGAVAVYPVVENRHARRDPPGDDRARSRAATPDAGDAS